MLKALSSRRLGLTIRELSDELRVGAKTIRRDLELFRDLGYPLVEETGEFGRKTYRMASPAGQPPTPFRVDEALALYLSRRLLEPLAGTLFWESAQSAFRKISASLGEKAIAYAEQMSCFFHPTTFGAGDYSKKAKVLDALTLAGEESKVAHVVYQSARATEPACRDLHPYKLVFHRGSIYLVAYDPDEQRIKHYKVDRIEDVEVSPFPFRRPADFDIDAHLRPTFGVYLTDGDVRPIKVRFAPAAARYVEESGWHPTAVLTRQRDGGLLAEFELASTEEFRSWILSFGSKATVLEPEKLRRSVAAELHAMSLAYYNLEPVINRRIEEAAVGSDDSG
jgi:predicted DNA-binding transcriptional regulator YafY